MNQLVQLGVRQLCSTPGTSPLLVRAGALLGKLAAQSKPCLHRQFPLHSSPAVLPSRGVATAGVLRAAVREQSGPGADGPADREPSPEAKYRARMFTVATGAACAFFGASYLLYRQLTVRAEEATIEQTTEPEAAEEEEKKKKNVSFHDRRVIGYEDRIRAYSTPDKIFRYFATLKIKEKNGSTHIYMTPDDFLRSITPGDLQPDGLGLDQFRSMPTEDWVEERSKMRVHPHSVFSRLGNHGLISFSDYLFLLTILGTPMRKFEIAFKMFDLNGDGEVDFKEFEKVQQVILSSTAVGARHRDHLVTGNVAGSVGDALVKHFFGEEEEKRLTVEEFQKFHRQLTMEILKLEFDRFDQVGGRITERDFAKLVLSYADMNDQRRKKYLKKIKKKYGAEVCPESKTGITFEEVRNFAVFLDSISDVEIALSMHSAAGACISVGDLQQVSTTVTGIDLSNHLVKVVFDIFDENDDGELSHKEFIKVMKSRTTRGLEKSKELGLAKVMSALLACGSKTIKDQLGIKS